MAHRLLQTPTGTGTPDAGDPDVNQLKWEFDEDSGHLYVNYPEDWGRGRDRGLAYGMC